MQLSLKPDSQRKNHYKCVLDGRRKGLLGDVPRLKPGHQKNGAFQGGDSCPIDHSCNGVPPLHDNLHKVNIKYEYCVRTNTIFSQYYYNR